MGLSGWPTVTDDDGSYAVGTVFNKALTDAILASIEADLFSSANPSVTAENIIDEVVAARGSMTDLDERMDVSINEDGTLKAQAGTAAKADVQGVVGQGNWVQNDIFIIWAKGDAVAPTSFTLTTVACAREASTKKVGAMSVKLTRSGSDGTLAQDVLNSGSMSAAGAYFKSRTFSFGAWVKTSVASHARLQLDDGVTTSETSYHTGGDTWEFLTTTHTLSASATKLTVLMESKNSNGDAYFSGCTVIPDENAVGITGWIPCPSIIGAIVFKYGNAVAVDTDLDRFSPHRACIIKDVRLCIITAPTDASLIVDINVYDGSAWQPAFTTKPKLLTTEVSSALFEPDGTYAYRCIEAGHANSNNDDILNYDVDQVGSSVGGSDLYTHLRMLQFIRPQESLLEADAV